MKKLLSMMLVLLSVIALAQKPKYIIVKNYRDGKVTAQTKVELPTKTNVIYKIVPKTRTITKVKKVEVIKIEYKLVNVPTPPTALDTVSILQAYYPKNAFKDILVLPDGQGRISIIDTISHNRLASRKWLSDINPKVVKERVEVTTPAVREYYLGPELSSNFRSINNWYSINLLIKNKANNIIKLGGGVNMRDGLDGAQPYLAAGFYLKIK